MHYLLYSIAIYTLLVFLPYLITFLQLCKLTLQYPKYQLQKADKVPAYLKQLFQTPIKELEQFGFKPYSYLQVEQMVKAYPPITLEILLYNTAVKTYAKVAIRRPAEPVALFDIEFYTLFRDRSLLLTMNGKAYSIVGEIPNFIIQDVYTAQTSVQWQAHQDELNHLTATKTPCGLAPDAFSTALQTYIKNYIDCLVKKGTVSQIKGALFRSNWLANIKIAKDLVQGASKPAGMLKQRRQQAKTDLTIQVEIPIELEVEEFQRMEHLQQGLIDNKLRTWLLLGSLGLFIASFINLFAPQSLAILIGVLLFHEGGHLLAMKLFGYQDASVLFLPFLGAVATARKDDATLTQKF